MNDQAVDKTEDDNVLPFVPRRLGLNSGKEDQDWLSPLKPGTVFVSLNVYSKGSADEYTVVRQDPRLTRLDSGDEMFYVVPDLFCRWNELILITGVNESYV